MQMKDKDNQKNIKEANNILNRHPIYRLRIFVPLGEMQGDDEYVALNPTCPDKKLKSLRVNIRTGKWSDSATGDKGNDLIFLYAYVRRLSESDAAKELLDRFGRKR